MHPRPSMPPFPQPPTPTTSWWQPYYPAASGREPREPLPETCCAAQVTCCYLSARLRSSSFGVCGNVPFSSNPPLRVVAYLTAVGICDMCDMCRRYVNAMRPFSRQRCLCKQCTAVLVVKLAAAAGLLQALRQAPLRALTDSCGAPRARLSAFRASLSRSLTRRAVARPAEIMDDFFCNSSDFGISDKPTLCLEPKPKRKRLVLGRRQPSSRVAAAARAEYDAQGDSKAGGDWGGLSGSPAALPMAMWQQQPATAAASSRSLSKYHITRQQHALQRMNRSGTVCGRTCSAATSSTCQACGR